MKKSTMAVAALLTALSSAPMVSVAYADDTSTPAAATCTGCKGCKGCNGCKGCKGCKGCNGCKGCGGCSGD
ncbi:hypothetical protein Lmor_0716 [Legionella moravica]|uniref:Metallothionein n=1 Tax=Legionella moravica TaxID=39962 RepID=A0A378K045_9GAMM|nr:hypothetical protein [Legionella moravica]KTD35269.1 hypothetical protein Lmor_0716 [Legionella moravica]STX62619.1 Uncharacterised protein [Legionella moravica]